MSDDDRKHLFKMFGKLKKTYHINQQGVGLGLMISKKLCEHLGGSISVDSRVGHGSVFTFSVSLGGKRHSHVMPNIRTLSYKENNLQAANLSMIQVN